MHGATIKWYTKDCHDRLMWCGRKNCLERAELAEMMKRCKKEKQSGKTTEPKKYFADDFKIALAVMTSAEDFQTLQEQFMGSKD